MPTTGESDYLTKLVVPDMKAYDRFLQEHLFSQAYAASVKSSVVLRELKHETALLVSAWQ
jgi:DNA-binding Lrp family transcriptional regulator